VGPRTGWKVLRRRKIFFTYRYPKPGFSIQYLGHYADFYPAKRNSVFVICSKMGTDSLVTG
jgi:hypothetical protein